MSSTPPPETRIPPHVPAHLVRDLDVFSTHAAAEADHDPFSDIDHALASYPRVFYSPHAGYARSGMWYLTHEEDLRRVMQDPQTFSSRDITGFSQLAGGDFALIPAEIDPPQHLKYRLILAPFFSPQTVASMASELRRSAIERIEQLTPQGGCEFLEAFGRPFPIYVVMRLMNLPLDMFETFCEWEWQLLHAPEMATRASGASNIFKYLSRVIAERRAGTADDLISRIAHAQVDGRALTENEAMGMTFLTFSGGLDTVASSLGFHFRHLARDPQLQEQLRREPELIPKAVDELLRVYGIVNVPRRVTRDVEIAGVQLKAGDWVALVSGFGNRDPRAFADPLQVKLDRRNASRHLTFSTGPHMCIGMHLARLELRIAIEEWLQRVPPFRLDTNKRARIHGGGVFGVDELYLSWT